MEALSTNTTTMQLVNQLFKAQSFDAVHYPVPSAIRGRTLGSAH